MDGACVRLDVAAGPGGISMITTAAAPRQEEGSPDRQDPLPRLAGSTAGPRWLLALIACLTISPTATATATAQELDADADADARAAQMIEDSRTYYGTKQPLRSCQAAAEPDEIVVCAHVRPDPRYEKVTPPRFDRAKMTAFGAPPVGGGVGGSVTVRGCFLQKCPKPLYIIDLKAIPEPPPGSDADLIARGEMRDR